MSTLRSGELRDRKIVHLHVPRTGGTSFARVLQAVYGGDEVTCLPGPESIRLASPLGIYLRDKDSLYWTDRPEFMKQWGEYLEECDPLPEIACWHGHTPLPLYPREVLDDRVIIVWLRDPVTLTLSWMTWERRFRELKNFDGSYDFVSQVCRHNIMFEMLGGFRGQASNRTVIYGIYEHYTRDLAFLANALRWETIELPHANNQEGAYVSSLRNQVLVQTIIASNLEDASLYQTAVLMSMF